MCRSDGAYILTNYCFATKVALRWGAIFIIIYDFVYKIKWIGFLMIKQ